MRNRMFIVLLAVSITGAAILHAKKPAKDTNNAEMEQLSNSLEPVKQFVPEGSSISFTMIDIKNEVFLWSRYLLAPRYVPYYPNERFDTGLTICKVDAGDSVLVSITNNRKLIWKYKDQSYYYFLTSAH